jgi:hypothetical protein
MVTLIAELMAVVEDTMQPEHLSLLILNKERK